VSEIGCWSKEVGRFCKRGLLRNRERKGGRKGQGRKRGGGGRETETDTEREREEGRKGEKREEEREREEGLFEDDEVHVVGQAGFAAGTEVLERGYLQGE
jgi:hypothetical protein